jgi:hypothetical protein
VSRQLISAACTALLATTLLGSSGGAAERPSGERQDSPAPLRGVPLGRETGLRLLVADVPPFVLDVDSGRATRMRDVPAVPRGVLWVVGVGGRAAVIVAKTEQHARLYAVAGRAARVAYLGTGTNVWPARGGGSVWVQSVAVRSRCAARLVGLDGRTLRVPRPFPCATRTDPAGGSLGVVNNRTRVLDPLTGRTILETHFRTRWGILAVAGRHVLLAGPGKQFTLIDATTRVQRRLPWPSILIRLDEPAVDPRGRFVAVAFADPAWRGGGQQVTDVSLLDAKTGKLTQLPGMPAFVSLKLTSMAWTHDGRLVLLGERNRRGFVAVWRPGQRRLDLKPVQLPDRSESGSDSFAPLA